LQILANRKGYIIEYVYFSNHERKIEKWKYSDLENDPCKHFTEYYKKQEEKYKVPSNTKVKNSLRGLL
jgi:hypothetical protein